MNACSEGASARQEDWNHGERKPWTVQGMQQSGGAPWLQGDLVPITMQLSALPWAAASGIPGFSWKLAGQREGHTGRGSGSPPWAGEDQDVDRCCALCHGCDGLGRGSNTGADTYAAVSIAVEGSTKLLEAIQVRFVGHFMVETHSLEHHGRLCGASDKACHRSMQVVGWDHGIAKVAKLRVLGRDPHNGQLPLPACGCMGGPAEATNPSAPGEKRRGLRVGMMNAGVVDDGAAVCGLA